MRWSIAFTAAMTALSPTGAGTRPFAIHSKSPYLELQYGWSSEANSVPLLVERFTADMRKQRSKMLADARNDAAERKEQGFPFNRYLLVTKITTAGQSPRLLSLRIDSYAFTGGAHGNSGTKGLLWDRRGGKEIAFDELFQRGPAFLAALHNPYCRALTLERAKRRQGEKFGGEFDRCPALSNLALIPKDSNHDGRFDTLLVVADPYVAGPYAEGEYAIGMPMNSGQIDKLKAEYRSSFGS
jgi:peptidoglycan-N-acetylmuramic acid deacetylase PdaC-like protein